jgi:hypothetical protein
MVVGAREGEARVEQNLPAHVAKTGAMAGMRHAKHPWSMFLVAEL